MDKCIIWGLGKDYEKIINQLKFEIFKGNIEITALVSKEDSSWCQRRDGYLLLPKDKLIDIDFDYLIITSNRFFCEIKKEILLLGIPENKIINGQVLNLPLFDWNRYISLIKNPITILSNNCWGGLIYSKLFLPFSSPLINLYIPSNSFLKFIQNPIYYLEKPLQMIREGDIRKNQCPIGKIGNGDDNINIIFTHSFSFKEAEELWNRRVKRINKDRLFVKYSVSGQDKKQDEYLQIFDKILLPKICFYSGETDIKNVVYLKRFESYVHQGLFVKTLKFEEYTLYTELLFKDIDVLKMLNGEDDFLR